MSAASLASYLIGKLKSDESTTKGMSVPGQGSTTPRLTTVWRQKSIPYDIPDTSPRLRNEGSLLKLLRTKSMPLLGKEGNNSPCRPAVRQQNDFPSRSKSSSPMQRPSGTQRTGNTKEISTGHLSDASESTVPSIATPPPTPRSPSPIRPRTRSASDGHLWQRRKKQLRQTTDQATVMLPSVKNLRGKFDEKPVSSPGDKQPTSHLEQTEDENIKEPKSADEREGRRVSRHYSLLRREVKSPERRQPPRPAVTPANVRKLLEKFETSPQNEDEDSNLFSRSDSLDLRNQSRSEVSLATKTPDHSHKDNILRNYPVNRNRKKNHRRSKSEPDPSAVLRHHAQTSPPSVKKLKLMFEREALAVRGNDSPHIASTLSTSPMERQKVKTPEPIQTKEPPRKPAQETVAVNNSAEDSLHMGVVDAPKPMQQAKTLPVNDVNLMLTTPTLSVRNLRKRFEEEASNQSLLKTAEAEVIPRPGRAIIHHLRTPFEEPEVRISRSVSPEKETRNSLTSFSSASVKNLLLQFEALSPDENRQAEHNLGREYRSPSTLLPNDSHKQPQTLTPEHTIGEAQQDIEFADEVTPVVKVDPIWRQQSLTSDSKSSSDDETKKKDVRKYKNKMESPKKMNEQKAKENQEQEISTEKKGTVKIDKENEIIQKQKEQENTEKERAEQDKEANQKVKEDRRAAYNQEEERRVKEKSEEEENIRERAEQEILMKEEVKVKQTEYLEQKKMEKEKLELEARKKEKEENQLKERHRKENEKQREREENKRKEREREENERKERERKEHQRKQKEKEENERKQREKEENERKEREREEIYRQDKEKDEIKAKEISVHEKAMEEKTEDVTHHGKSPVKEKQKFSEGEGTKPLETIKGEEMRGKEEIARKLSDDRMGKGSGRNEGHEDRNNKTDDNSSDRKVHEMIDHFTLLRLDSNNLPLPQDAHNLPHKEASSEPRIERLIDQFTNLRDADLEGEIERSDAHYKLDGNDEENGRRYSDVAALVSKFRKLNEHRKSSSSSESESEINKSHEKPVKEEAPIPTIPARSNVPGKVRTLREDEMRFFESLGGAGTEPFMRTQSLRVKKDDSSNFVQPRFGSLRGNKSRVAVLSNSSTATAALPRNCRHLKTDELQFFTGEVTNIYRNKTTKSRGRAGKSGGREVRPHREPQNNTLPDTEEFFRLGREDPGGELPAPNVDDSDSEESVLRNSDDVITDSEGDIYELDINLRSDADTEDLSDTEHTDELDQTLSLLVTSIKGELLQPVVTEDCKEAESRCYVVFSPKNYLYSSEEEDEAIQFSFPSKLKENDSTPTVKENGISLSEQVEERILPDAPVVGVMLSGCTGNREMDQSNKHIESEGYILQPLRSTYSTVEDTKSSQNMDNPEHGDLGVKENDTSIDFLGDTNLNLKPKENFNGLLLTELETSSREEIDCRDEKLEEIYDDIKIDSLEDCREERCPDGSLLQEKEDAITNLLLELDRLDALPYPTPLQKEDPYRYMNDDDSSSNTSDEEDHERTILDADTMRSIEEQIIPSASNQELLVCPDNPSSDNEVPQDTPNDHRDTGAPLQDFITHLTTTEDSFTSPPPLGTQESLLSYSLNDSLKKEVEVEEAKVKPEENHTSLLSQYPEKPEEETWTEVRDSPIPEEEREGNQTPPSSPQQTCEDLLTGKEFIKFCIFSLWFSFVMYFFSEMMN